jgi:hypothetical protein
MTTLNRRKLTNRIKALLAKTTENGCTEEEALSALAKAQAMIDAYEITDEELVLTREEKAILREDKNRDHHDIKWFLCQSVAEFTGTRIWRRRHGHKSRTGSLVVCGLPGDCDLAEWLLEHLSRFVQMELADFLYNHNTLMRGSRRRVINGFTLGCTERINQRLYALIRQSRAKAEGINTGGASRALVLADIKRNAVASAMAAAGIETSIGRIRRKTDNAAQYAGTAAGERATFGRPVSGGGPLRLR